MSQSKGATFHHKQPSLQSQRRLVGGLSFADVLKKGVVKEKQLLRINVTPNRKRLVRWISQSEVSKRPKGNVLSRLGPKLSVFSRLGPGASSSHVLSTSGPSTRNGKKVILKQIWVPKVKEKSLLGVAPLCIP